MASSHTLDQLDTCFDDIHAIANAGLLLPATLAQRLGIQQTADQVIDLGEQPGAHRPGRIAVAAGGGGAGVDRGRPARRCGHHPWHHRLERGLGFANEFRSERAVEALHDRIRHTALTLRDGRAVAVDVTELVPGDLVRLGMGDVVPADLRLLEADGLECDEAVLTGESLAEPKTAKPAKPSSPLELPSCALMGTVVHAGTGLGVVVRTGPRTAFGQIAVRLGERHEQTAFQRGLRDFSGLLVRITGVLAVSIFVINAVLGRSLLEAGLFALAIAVGLTPQLLPAI